MLKVGIIGGGFFGEKHAQALSAVQGARLVAVSRRNSEALRSFADRYGIKGFQDYRDLLNDPEIDTVVVATPHYLHTDITLQAANLGKHILLEKPMALTLEDCDAIIEAVNKSEVSLMVGHLNQFARCYQKAKEIIDSGEVGDVVFGISRMSKIWFQENRRPWHLDRKTGGGMWLTAGMHCLDRLTWLIGSEAERVCAQFDTRFHDQEADDVGLVFLRFRNGSFGSVVSTGWKVGVTDHLTEMTCTKGMLRIEYAEGVSIGRDEKWLKVPESGSSQWMEEALLNEWRAFISAIEKGTPSPVTGSYARHIMSAVFAAEESSKSKCEIAL